jgi:trk system potassium uptake protein TrkA
MTARVLLIGGFQEARYLASSLLKKGHRVTAIIEDPQQCRALAEIDRLEVYMGDGTKPFVLEDASAYDAGIAIAMTGTDEGNLVACELCKKKFRVQKTVAVISDPKKTDFFYRMGVDSVICAISVVSSVIEQQAFLDEVATLVPVGEGQVRVTQVPISAASPAAGKKLWQVNLPGQVVIGCVMRGGKSLVPRGETRILAGDVVALISAGQHEKAAVRALTGR